MAKFKTNKLYIIALEMLDKAIKEEDIRNNDLTNIFYDELLKIIKNKELVNITINGLTTKGKSTVAMAICQWLLKNAYNKKMSLNNITRDQREFSKLTRNNEIGNTIIVVDEWDDVEETGENSTVEKAILDNFNKVQSQRYIHRIACSPSDQIDQLSDIVLEVVQADKKRKITHCYLYYRVLRHQYMETTLIGHVNIEVKDVLDKLWYKRYVERKFEKMDLLIQEGVIRPRMLEYAGMVRNVVDKLKKLVKIGILNKDIIQNYVRNEFMKQKEGSSLIGLNEMTKEINGILVLYKSLYQIRKELNVLEKKYATGKITEFVKAQKKAELKESLAELAEAIELQEQQLTRMVEIKQKYEILNKKKETKQE